MGADRRMLRQAQFAATVGLRQVVRQTLLLVVDSAKAGRLTLRRSMVAVSLGLAVLVAAGLARAVDGDALAAAGAAAAGDPVGIAVAVGAFAGAFALRARAWCGLLPGLPFGQSLAALHVALAANHLLPFRLGEATRVVSVVQRTPIPAAEATATALLLRVGDVVALAALGMIVGPLAVWSLIGAWGAVVLGVTAVVGVAAGAVVVRQAERGSVRVPGAATIATVVAAWLAEAIVVAQVARWFGVELSANDAVLVLAAAVTVQVVAVTPGGIGTYEAAASAALVAVGVPAATALTVAVGLHAAKTLYSLVAGAVALVVPAPALVGRRRRAAGPRPALVRPPGPGPRRWRLPVVEPIVRPAPPAGPVVLFLPAHDEAATVAGVIARAPSAIDGHPVEVVVVDDGSGDDTAVLAARAGARVVAHPVNRGLGAAVRTGLRDALDRGASAVAFCDADGEYDPAELDRLVGPILGGAADYVVGTRFGGHIHHMRPHRRLGNQVLTAWVRWVVRQPVTDGQSGYRALSPAAAAHADIAHDYNYAQVLTVGLVGRGFRYHEVPISYSFRTTGRSFVRLGRYLRRVVPTVVAQVRAIAAGSPSPAPAPGPALAPAPAAGTGG